MTTCTFPACEKPTTYAGYCGGHHRQIERGQELRPLRGHDAAVRITAVRIAADQSPPPQAGELLDDEIIVELELLDRGGDRGPVLARVNHADLHTTLRREGLRSVGSYWGPPWAAYWAELAQEGPAFVARIICTRVGVPQP